MDGGGGVLHRQPPINTPTPAEGRPDVPSDAALLCQRLSRIQITFPLGPFVPSNVRMNCF